MNTSLHIGLLDEHPKQAAADLYESSRRHPGTAVAYHEQPHEVARELMTQLDINKAVLHIYDASLLSVLVRYKPNRPTADKYHRNIIILDTAIHPLATDE